MVEVDDVGLVNFIDVADVDPLMQLTAKAKSKVFMATPLPKLMVKAKMLMAIPQPQNAGKDNADDSKIGGKTPC